MRLQQSKVLIVGCGLTGAVAASLISETASKLVLNEQPLVELWEKSRGVGGRMATWRNARGVTVDLGAQFFSLPMNADSSDSVSFILQKVKSQLSSLDVDSWVGFKPSDRFLHGTHQYVAPSGSSAIVKAVLNTGTDRGDVTKKNPTIVFNRRLSCLKLKQESSVFEAFFTDSKSKAEGSACFDAVILTQPVPQILELTGDISSLFENQPSLLTDLKSVRYSSRFALGLTYPEGTKLPVPWTVKFFEANESPVFRYVAIDSKKRNDPDCNHTAVVVHTSISYGSDNVEDTPANQEAALMAEYRRLFPDWPEPLQIRPHKWRYSQVLEGFPGSPLAVELQTDPLIVAAGDGFVSRSGLLECVSSGIEAADKVWARLRRK